MPEDDKRHGPDDDPQRDAEYQPDIDDDHAHRTGIHNFGQGVPTLDSDVISPNREPAYVQSPTRADYDARISLELHENGKLVPAAIDGEQGWVLRESFADAIRFHIKNANVLRKLATLIGTAWLRLEVSTNFSRELPDAAIAELIADSAIRLNKIDWDRAKSNASKRGVWAVPVAVEREGTWYLIEYSLVLWHPDPAVKEIIQKYKEVQEERARIDAERDQWLAEKAQPLIDELADTMLNASLPQVDEQTLRELLGTLRRDAYYRNLIGSPEVLAQLGRTGNVLQRQKEKGLMGFEFAKTRYVFHQSELDAFAKRERPAGGDNRKKR